jgi:uncharacterized protein (DUF2236 family)
VATDVAPGFAGVFGGFPRPDPGRTGDPGLFGPGSMVWRVNGETAMLFGSGRALLMQIAHPMVAAGVADHSDFRADAFSRLWRTLDAVLTVAFGDTRQAEAAADRVTQVHRRVSGMRSGEPYRALDPELLLWVHATLVDSALVTYRGFVGPIDPADEERYHQEMKRFAVAFQVPSELLPADLAAFRRYLAQTVAGLEVSVEARRLAEGILSPPVRGPLVPARGLLRLAAVGLLPPAVRGRFGLAWSPLRERELSLAAAAVRRTLPALPAKVRRWPHARLAEARLSPNMGPDLRE